MEFKSGSVVFRQTTFSEGQTYVAECDHRWDRNAFTVQIEAVHQPSGLIRTLRVLTPQGHYDSVDGQGAKVVSFGGRNMIDSEPFLDVIAGPCLPIGRLPVVLHQSSVDPARYSVGSDQFLAFPGERGLMSQVDRLGSNGSVSARYTYSGFLRNSTGGWVPRAAKYSVVNGSIDYWRSFEFESARFGEKPDLKEFLTNWNQPGFQIADRRVSPEVVWTSEELTKLNGGNPKITPDELLRFSKRRSAFFHSSIKHGKRQVAKQESRQQTTVWIAVGVVVLMAATYVVPYLLKRRAARLAK